jgi:hypothetical protein
MQGYASQNDQGPERANFPGGTAFAPPLPVADMAKLLGATVGPALRLLLQPGTLRQLPRLMQEGIQPIVRLLIQANNIAIINQWLNKGSKVVFLSSYPRSGNTWMRYLLSDVLLQMHNVETATKLPVHPDNLIPEYRCNLIARRILRRRHWAIETPAAFVKNHVSFTRLEKLFSGNGRRISEGQPGGRRLYRDCRAVYLYRAPEDALVSYYHFCPREVALRSRAANGVEAFCRTELPGWVENISSYIRAWDNGFPVFFVSYEQLLARPGTVLSDILHWLGVQHDGQMVQRAIANMQFDKMQAMELESNKTRNPANGLELFFRRGCPGSGRAELQESTLREIREQTASLINEADRRQMKQPPELIVPAAMAPNGSRARAPLPNGEARESRTSPCLQQM